MTDTAGTPATDSPTPPVPSTPVQAHHSALTSTVDDIAAAFANVVEPVVADFKKLESGAQETDRQLSLPTPIAERVERIRAFAGQIHAELDAIAQHLIAHGGL